MIFAHFNTKKQLSLNVVRLLKWYSRHVTSIIFVTTSELDTEDYKCVSEFCDEVLVRENVGYDFMSWQCGLAAYLSSTSEFDEIILTNDSVLGPLFPCEDLFERLTALPNDICGLTANWEYGWHIQSWFVCYKKRAFNSPIFQKFWTDIQVQNRKLDIILKYEVGLQKAMLDAGFTLGVLHNPKKTNSLGLRACIWIRNFSFSSPMQTIFSFRYLLYETVLNPAHFGWDELIRDGIPFVKKELLLKNPLFVNTSRIRRYYPQVTSYLEDWKLSTGG